MLPLRKTAHGKKEHALLTCSHVCHMSYHMSQLRYQFTGRDMPLQKLSGVAIFCPYWNVGFQNITSHRATNFAKSQAKIRFAFHFVERK